MEEKQEETKKETTEIKKEVVEVKQVHALVETDERGVVAPKTLEDAYRYAKYVFQSKLAPSSLDSVEKVLVAMQTASELGLQPLSSLKSMYVINGTVSLFGDLPLALVRRSGLLEKIQETQYDVNGLLMNSENKNLDAECSFARCVVKRKGEQEEIREFSWNEAVKSGLTKDKWGDKKTYLNFRKRMLQMRSRSWALKDIFPDVLLGVAIFEYDNFKEDVREVNDKANNFRSLVGAEE